MVSMGLKAAGCVLMIAGASGYGAWLAGNYGRRLAVLEELRRMIFLLKGQILYAKLPLEEAFEAVGRRTEGILAQLISEGCRAYRQSAGGAFCGHLVSGGGKNGDRFCFFPKRTNSR